MTTARPIYYSSALGRTLARRPRGGVTIVEAARMLGVTRQQISNLTRGGKVRVLAWRLDDLGRGRFQRTQIVSAADVARYGRQQGRKVLTMESVRGSADA